MRWLPLLVAWLAAAQAGAEPVSERLARSLAYPARTATVAAVRFSADGSRLFAAGERSGELKSWDVATGRELRPPDTPPALRNSIDYATRPGGRSNFYLARSKGTTVRFERGVEQVARTAYEGEVLVFDGNTGQQRPSLKPPAGRGVSVAAVAPDGRKLITVEQLPWDEIRRRGNGPFDFVVVRETMAMLWDGHTATSRPLANGFAQAAFSPDSRKVALSVFPRNDGEPGVLQLLDAEGDKLADVTAGKDEVFGRPVVSPDGKVLAAFQGKDRVDQPHVLRVFDLSTLKEVAAFPSGGDFPFTAFAFSPDGRRLAARDYKGCVRVWDIAAGRPILTTSLGEDMGVPEMGFVPDGRRLAVYGQPKWDPNEFGREADPRRLPQPRVFLFDLAAPAVAPEVLVCPHGRRGGLAVSPDGRTLAVGGTGAVHLFDITDPPGPKR